MRTDSKTIKFARLQEELSQENVARLLCLGRTGYTKIELGKRELKLSEIRILANASPCFREALHDLIFGAIK